MKRNANAVAAILENFETAEKALNVALNSTGSAAAENAKHLESIAGRISQFQAAWQTLSQTVVNSDFVKHIVSFGTALINATNGIAELVGGTGMILATLPALVGAYQKFEKFRNLLNGIKTAFTSFVGGAK